MDNIKLKMEPAALCAYLKAYKDKGWDVVFSPKIDGAEDEVVLELIGNATEALKITLKKGTYSILMEMPLHGKKT